MNVNGKHAGLSGLFLAAALIMGGCGASTNTSETPASTGPDPAAGNLASTDQSAATPVANSQPAAAAPVYSQPAPQQAVQNAPQYSQPDPSQQDNSQQYSDSSQYADVDNSEPPVEATDPPPPLPDYSQPECPGENYIWTPGSLEFGSWHPTSEHFGPRLTGTTKAPAIDGIAVIGAAISASTAASTTVSATSAADTMAAIGTTTCSLTTAQ